MPKLKTKPLFSWLPQRRHGSVQQFYVGAQEIADDVIVLATGKPKQPDYCAVIDTGSLNYTLLSTAEQKDILDAYREFLASLAFPIQIIIQVTPLDLRPYLAETRELAAQQGGIWPDIAADHNQFINELSAQRTFLDRHFYIVIAYERESEGMLRRRRNGIRQSSKDGDREQAILQLKLRSEKVIRDLDRINLKGHRLAGEDLAHCYARAIAPERARLKPVTADRLRAIGAPSQPDGAADRPLALPAIMIADDRDAAPEASAPAPTKPGKTAIPATPALFADLADVLAPTSVELKPDHLIIDGQYARTLFASKYPRYANAGWLARLIDHDLPMDVALHVAPRDTVQMIKRLQRKSDELTASQRIAERHQGRGNIEAAIALSDIGQIIERLQRGDEKILHFALYVTVRAATLDQLNERTTQVDTVLESLQIDTRPAMFEQDLAYRCIVPEGRDRLRRGYEHDTGTVTMAFPFVSNTLSMPRGILYGTAPNGSPVILDPFSGELENSNEVIFAKSGAGKSYGVKTLVTRLMARGVQAFVIDPEDEYRALAMGLGGQVIDQSAGSAYHINPFDLPAGETTAAALAEKIQNLQALFDLMLADRTPLGAAMLTQAEKGLIDRALHHVYRDADERGATPRLADLYDVLRSAEDGPDETHLADRLYRYVHGSLAGMFNHATNIELTGQLVVFNVRGLDDELQPLALYLIADYVWTRITREQRPRMLLIDEAWVLMQFPEGARFLAGLARRARKYWLSIVTITQSVADFLQSEYGQAILQNSSIKVLMKQDSTTVDAVTTAFSLSPQERQYLLGAPVGSGLLFARGSHVQIQIRASQAEHRLATTNPRELAAWHAAEIAVAAVARS